MLIANLPLYADEFEYENFTYDIDCAFKEFIGRKVYIKGKNLTWRNLEGATAFTLKNPQDIWKKLTPNTDISFEIETLNGKKDENLYKAVCFHHDCPTGEKFQIQISNKPIEEMKDERFKI